ncbi:ankyrin repeat domain-containing protein [Mesobacillus jeotgali]|uniref:ankyrin repeat domain-containing protein n=1 Tax=Mesobacillus jeotgali TaxID=129985 RepID=UPI0017856F02|nr:ankyrin repeat domain-containing protein [Mesobacillus jeotgali]UYZ21738.1 ankyrin repeat domain-containing protein [Mesobacillus jeotgali]
MAQFPHIEFTPDEKFTLLKENMSLKIDELVDSLLSDSSFSISQLNELLHRALRFKYKYAVEAFLQKGANPNGVNYQGIAPLNLTTLYTTNQKQIVNSLLKHGADPNLEGKDNSTPVAKAALFCNFEILKMLQEAGGCLEGKHLNTALSQAAQRNDQHLIDGLLEMGAEITNNIYFMCAVSFQPAAIPYLLMKDDKFSLNIEDNFNFFNAAVSRGYLNIIKLYIKKGKQLTTMDHFKRTLSLALFAAIQENDGRMVKYLIEQGADVNYIDEDETPLDFAMSTGKHSMASLLRKLGGSRNGELV